MEDLTKEEIILKFQGIDGRFKYLEADLKGFKLEISKRFDTVEDRLDRVEKRLDSIDKKLNEILTLLKERA